MHLAIFPVLREFCAPCSPAFPPLGGGGARLQARPNNERGLAALPISASCFANMSRSSTSPTSPRRDPRVTARQGRGGVQPTGEASLYGPVKRFLEAQGFEVKGEVRGCDLVARRGDEPPVIVELKLRFTLALVLQGIDRLALS